MRQDDSIAQRRHEHSSPSSTRVVRAATAARNVSGSWRGLAVSKSPTHKESNPSSSVRVASC
jgi:hypothetical protein